MNRFSYPAFPIGNTAILFVTLIMFFGCSWVRPTVTPSPPPKEAAAVPSLSQPTSGSLWNDHGELARLYSDNRASRIGDIVTIRIVENAAAAQVDEDFSRQRVQLWGPVYSLSLTRRPARRKLPRNRLLTPALPAH